MLGLAPNSALKRHVGGLEESTAARFKATPGDGKVRRFKEFFDAAKTWSRVRRIVARVEAGSGGTDTRVIVTNLGDGRGRSLYVAAKTSRAPLGSTLGQKNHLATGPLASTTLYKKAQFGK